MTAMSFRSSRPNNWVEPRPYTDPHLRRLNYGKVQPMEREPGRLRRLLARAHNMLLGLEARF